MTVFSDFYVDIVCPCGHSTIKQPEEMKVAGMAAAFEELKKRMRCKQCGKKEVEIIVRRNHVREEQFNKDG